MIAGGGPPEPSDKQRAWDGVVSRQAEYDARRSKAGRDIGPTPEIENVERRESCRNSIELFGKTYHPRVCNLELSDDHREMIRMIEEAIRFGALYALALPRGSGKSSWCRIACHWAISYAHVTYPFLIGATKDKAVESLDTIKTWCRFNQEWAGDFPEISYPAQQLGGIAMKASGQLCCGRSTQIAWEKDRVVLPVVPPAPNDPRGKDREFAATSGIVFGVEGLTGDGIRGSLFAHPQGYLVRPDFVLLDDPQTDESAGSDKQNDVREELVAGAVLGMAGPDKRISAVMPCTKIKPNDMACRILDRNRNPLWRGTCRSMLKSMPRNMGAWDRYFEVYAQASIDTPGDLTIPNAWFTAHEAELIEGAEASWPQRKYSDEASPIQHAMHFFFRNRKKFFAEYQNDPEDEVQEQEFLDAQGVSYKVNSTARGIIPIECDKLTAFIDIHGDVLYYVVCAWDISRFDGTVIDYATWPGQPTRTFTLRTANETLSKLYPHLGPEAQLRRGLDDLKQYLLGREWKREDGVPMGIERMLIDVGYQTRIVERWIVDQKTPIIMPAKGIGVKVKEKPFDDIKLKPGEEMGFHWRVMKPSARGTLRRVEIDTNFWKTFTHRRLAVAIGDPGCLTLYREDYRHHQQFGEHVCCEFRKTLRDEKSGRAGDEWQKRPGKVDNHWGDGLVGCTVGASMLGAKLVGVSTESANTRKRQRAAAPPPRSRRV
jgi:hypothetical protein